MHEDEGRHVGVRAAAVITEVWRYCAAHVDRLRHNRNGSRQTRPAVEWSDRWSRPPWPRTATSRTGSGSIRRTPVSLRVYEEWESEDEALNGHMATEHMATFMVGVAEIGVTGVAINKPVVAESSKLM